MAATERQTEARLNYPNSPWGRIQRALPKPSHSEGFTLSRSDRLLRHLLPIARQVHQEVEDYLHDQFGDDATPQSLTFEQRQQLLEHAGTFPLGEDHFQDGTQRIQRIPREQVVERLPQLLRQISEVAIGVLGMQPTEQQIVAPPVLLDPTRLKPAKKSKKGSDEETIIVPQGKKDSPRGRDINAPTGSGKSIDVFETAAVCALLDDGMSLEIHETREDLAIRNFLAMAPALHALGIRTAIILTDGTQYIYDPTIENPEGRDQMNLRYITRIQAYQDTDITWGVYTEFGHDYERDNLEMDPNNVRQPKPLGQRRVIIDEVQDIHIKNAHTPLVSSSPIEIMNPEDEPHVSQEIPYTHSQMCLIFAHIVEQLQEGIDYTRDIPNRQAWWISPEDTQLTGKRHQRTRERAEQALHQARTTRVDIYLDIEHLDSPTPVPANQTGSTPFSDLRTVQTLEEQGFTVGKGIPENGDFRNPIGLEAVEVALRRIGLLKPDETLQGYTEEQILRNPQLARDQERIMKLQEFLLPALQVKAFYRRGEEYDTKPKTQKQEAASVIGEQQQEEVLHTPEGTPIYEVLVRDTHRGRVVYGRRFADGIHAALEARERIAPDNQDKYIAINLDALPHASIQTRSLYRRYGEIFGFSGTATGSAHELYTFYGTDVISIPSSYENARQIEPMQSLHLTKAGKIEDIAGRVETMCFYADGPHYRAPILIDVRSKADVQRIYERLKEKFVDPYNETIDFLFAYINYRYSLPGSTLPATIPELLTELTRDGFLQGQSDILNFQQFAATREISVSIANPQDLRQFMGSINEQFIIQNDKTDTPPPLTIEFFGEQTQNASKIEIEFLTDDVPGGIAEAERRVKRAGQYGHIIVTNIIEIGSDPTLGGQTPRSIDERARWQAVMNLLLEKQGLVIIGEHRDTSADLQLIGRTARQGNPGYVIFIASAEDEFMLQGLSEEEREDLRKLLEKNHGVIEETGINKSGREYIKRAIRNVDNQNARQLESVVSFYPILDDQREIYYTLRRSILQAPLTSDSSTTDSEQAANLAETIIREVTPYIEKFKTRANLTEEQMRRHAGFILDPIKTLERHLQRFSPADLAGLRAYILHRLDQLWTEYYAQEKGVIPLMQYRQTPNSNETAEKAFTHDADRDFKELQRMLREEILTILTGITTQQ